MKGSFLKLVIAAAALGVLLAGPTVGPAAAETIELSYANFPPPITFPCVQMERWKAEVQKRTDGKVQIDTYPGGTLLGAKEMMDGVIAGQADIGNLCQAYQPGRFIVSNATALPLHIPNAYVGSMVLWDLYKKYKPKAFEKVKVLTMFVSAPANIMSKTAVRNLDDLDGLSLRASGSAARILGAWGANPVGMPMSATPEALQKGTVKGLFSSLEVMKDFKFAELCKYITRTDEGIYPFAVVMNMETWNGLPADVKKVMEDLGDEQAEWTGRYMDKHVEESVAWSVKEQDVEVIELSDAEKAKWNAKLDPLVDEWIAEQKAAGYPADQIVKDVRALMDKYSK